MQEINNSHSIITDGLNPRQKEAVLNITGPQLIIAGAGSGKTKVLTARIANLLDKGVLPERILALTFTKKAAEEMKSRITGMVGNCGRRVCMGTFHSVFIRFIRPYAQFLGFPQNFTILDEEDSLKAVGRCVDQIVKAGRKPVEMQTEAEMKAYKEIDLRYKPSVCKKIFSSAKNKLITAADYANDKDIYLLNETNRVEKMGEIFQAYANYCFQSGAMDFDDILLYTDMLLHSFPEVRMQIASMFDYIMIDEYQDTNFAQYSIMRWLTERNNNICVVGDDSQSIYAFRGAIIENIINFKNDYKGCKVVKLEQNYRSTRTIVDAANRLISNNEQRLPKVCFSEGAEGDGIDCLDLPDDRKEAMFIADTIISDMKRNGYRYKDFAVLYRTNAQSRQIEDALIRRNIPYVIYSGTSFFERMEVKDVMAYLKLAVNPKDNESLLRVINKPVRGVGPATQDKLVQYARQKGVSIWDVLCSNEYLLLGLGPKTIEGIGRFRGAIEYCITQAAEKSAYQAAYNIEMKTGLRDEYDEKNSEDADRINNIRELIDSVKGYEDELEKTNSDGDLPMPSTLGGYLENVMLLSNADTDKGNDDKVSLMTVHCAKGLEYPEVFVAGMEESLFPLIFKDRSTQKDLEEERRLFYVAVTRAKSNLVLTRAQRRLRFGKYDTAKPSRFLRELLEEA